MKEGNADMSFKKSERPAYRSRRSPQLTPRFPQAALVEGCDEDLHGVDSVHLPPSNRWDHAVLFHQKHMRLKDTTLGRGREHEYLFARRQVRPRHRSKGYDWRVFR